MIDLNRIDKKRQAVIYEAQLGVLVPSSVMKSLLGS